MEIFEITPLTAGEAKGQGRGRPQGSVAKIRFVHHTVARLHAEGLTPSQIAAVVGRSPATIRNYLSAPANQQLVAEYEGAAAKRLDSELEYRAELRRAIATKAAELMLAQLEEAELTGERLPLDKLVKLAGDSDDRTGLARQETKINMNLDLGARLDKALQAKADVDASRGSKVLPFLKRV